MTFLDFFKAGFQDFISLNVFGHLFVIIALCCVYTLTSWKTVLSFLLSFMAGWLISFFLTWFGFIKIPQEVLRLLIPITIITIASTNFFVKKKVFTDRYPSQDFRYYLGFIAGVIHGFAFTVPHSGNELIEAVIYSSGVLISTTTVTFITLLVALFLTYFLRVRLREWILIVSGACAGIAIFKLLLSIY